jgi:hypothetical protein
LRARRAGEKDISVCEERILRNLSYSIIIIVTKIVNLNYLLKKKERKQKGTKRFKKWFNGGSNPRPKPYQEPILSGSCEGCVIPLDH